MLKVDNLSFSYTVYESTSNRVLFDNVSFECRENENVLILGRPEKGKSTLSMILSGLTPKYNDGNLTGSVTYDSLSCEEALERMNIFSLVPQNATDFIITSTVEEEVVFPMQSLCIEREEMKKRLDEALSFWGLNRYRDISTSELSGGEKRRLMLATSDVVNSKYNILDEAFDDLDVSYRKKLSDRLKERKRATVVFASHYLNCFDSVFDKVYILDGTLALADNSSIEEFSKIEHVVFENKLSSDELIVKNLTFTHPHRSVLEEEPFKIKVDNFSLKRGEVITLRGLNGSGKSTFSSILCGLYEKDSGEIIYRSKSLKKKELSRIVGYMFQNPDFQIFLPTAYDELAFALDYLKLSSEEKERRVKELLKLFRLNGDAVASLMSYGERKRLQCAIYYSLNRPFYILDELDSALDYEESIRLIKLLSANGAGILLITHDEAFADAITNHGYYIENGVMYAN